MRGVVSLQAMWTDLGVVFRELGARCVVHCLVVSMFRQQTTFLDAALRLKGP